ncbi:TNF receptor-associated factor family protein DDB_G0272829-like [Limulus polyphemus]|uniref:TNF receptor-associated factor family protein DDB_G0272829-like n=1 Tax=Limulus polyphemus TaxID=6850 RepID=A0ABM1C616_LIMPO|nr:TNF receptor-associated factor family protein DDB_G0272829-like [Limulus polyphemus]XP_022238205.1 TNF receptor-associated factor family protein DDB_G0272829-like [Limulus polyphemus]
MSLPKSVYSLENFDPAPDDELLCSICQNVYCDPVECSCRHVFCRSCISSWLDIRKTCPICRKKTYFFDIKPVVPIVTNMISKLTIKCPNFTQGCNQKITLDNYLMHKKVCNYEMVECSNPDCRKKMKRKKLERHQFTDCKYRLVTCQKDCGLQVPFMKKFNHNCVEELKKQLTEAQKYIAENDALKEEIRKLQTRLEEKENHQNNDSFQILDTFSPTRNNFEESETSDDLYSDYSDTFNSEFSLRSFSPLESSLSPPESPRIFRSEISYYQNSGSQIHRVSETPHLGGPETHHSENLSIRPSRTNNSQEDLDRQDAETTEQSINISDNFASQTSSIVDVFSSATEDAGDNQNSSYPRSRFRRLVVSTSFFPCDSDTDNDPETSTRITGDQHSEDQNDSPVRFRRRVLKRKTPIRSLSDSSDDNPNTDERATCSSSNSNEMNFTKSVSTNKEKTRDSGYGYSRCTNGLQKKSCKVSFTSGCSGETAVTQDMMSQDGRTSFEQEVFNFTELDTTTRRNEANVTQVNYMQSEPQQGNSLNNWSGENTKRIRKVRQDAVTYRNSGDTYKTSSKGEVCCGEATSCEVELLGTAAMLEAYSVEDDPEWVPPLETEELSDDITDDEWDTESEYEVEVPERTWDLIMRYVNTPSDDDEEWQPRRLHIHSEN